MSYNHVCYNPFNNVCSLWISPALSKSFVSSSRNDNRSSKQSSPDMDFLIVRIGELKYEVDGKYLLQAAKLPVPSTFWQGCLPLSKPLFGIQCTFMLHHTCSVTCSVEVKWFTETASWHQNTSFSFQVQRTSALPVNCLNWLQWRNLSTF